MTTEDRDTSLLFSPAGLGDIALKNKVVMSPMTRSRAGAGDAPTALNAEYYRQRAGAGMIVTEGTQPSPAGKGYVRTPGIYSVEQVEGWRTVVDAVHREGGTIVVQLMHCGRVASRLNKMDDSEIVAPSAIRANAKIHTDTGGWVEMETPRALATSEIPVVIGEYESATRNAVAAGFDGVELHCSSGYLPMQFLSSNTNKRTDRYGGSVGNRVRFALETLEAMSGAIGSARVGLRVCPGFDFNDIHDENPAETYALLMQEASKLNLAYLHLVRRTFGELDNYALVKKHWRGNLVLNNELTFESATRAVTQGDCEAASFGRGFIANPDLVERFRTGVPLSDYKRETLYAPGPEGYTDYPTAS